jgi:hypothetical protein
MPTKKRKPNKTGTARKRKPVSKTPITQPVQPVVAPVVLASQTHALALAEQLFNASKACRCQSCKSMLLREKAEALAVLVAKVMEVTMQKSSEQYMDALHLLAKCRASTPVCGGGGWAMPSNDVVYDRCVRTEPVLGSHAGLKPN